MSEPIHIISLGAGVQSSTMALMAAAGEITPMPVAAIFADTQAEPASVYRWLDWIEKQLPFPVYRVTAGNLADRVLVPRRINGSLKFTFVSIPAFIKNSDGSAGIMDRQCTHDFKIAPIDKVITRELRRFRVKRAIKWIGISTDEIWRAKPSVRKTVTHRWPLLEKARFNRQKCLSWMKHHGFPQPPRSACIFCPYHGQAEWLSLTDDEFSSAIMFEREFQSLATKTNMAGVPFLHKSLKPLSEVDFSTEEDRGQLNMFNNECEGMCGV